MQQNKQNNFTDTILVSARANLKSGNIQAAVSEYNEVLKYDDKNFEALLNLASIFMQSNNVDTAEKIYNRLAIIYPKDDRAYNSLGVISFQKKDCQNAIRNFKKASELKNSAPYLQNLASVHFALKEYDKSLEYLKKAHDLDNKNVGILAQLADLCYSHSYSESENYIKKLYELSPDYARKISSELFIPSVYESQEEINLRRKNIEHNLSKILLDFVLNPKDVPQLKPDEKLYIAPFYLAYHNLNNKNIKTKLAELDLKLFPFLNYTAEHIKNYKYKSGEKIKIGFAGSFFHKHPVSQCFNGLILELAKDERFDVHVFYYGNHMKFNRGKNDDEYLNKLKSGIKNYHEVDGDYSTIQSFLASKRLDILIFPEIGMFTNSVGYRVAPIQVVLPGHPDTTGLKNIDYYFSTDDLEGENAEEHYSEKLVRFKSIINYIDKQPEPEKFKIRKELGLPESKHIYYCPMKSQKLHPDFDLVIREILEKDEKAVILFPKDTGKNSEIIKNRIRKNLGSLATRILYHDWVDNLVFLSFLHQSDVILDTFYFGAGTTTYFVLTANAPMVTLPGKTTGGRVACAVSKRIGTEELIAKDKEDYVNIAIKIANNKEYRESIVGKIRGNKHVVFENPSVVDEIKGFIIKTLSDL